MVEFTHITAKHLLRFVFIEWLANKAWPFDNSLFIEQQLRVVVDFNALKTSSCRHSVESGVAWDQYLLNLYVLLHQCRRIKAISGEHTGPYKCSVNATDSMGQRRPPVFSLSCSPSASLLRKTALGHPYKVHIATYITNKRKHRFSIIFLRNHILLVKKSRRPM